MPSTATFSGGGGAAARLGGGGGGGGGGFEQPETRDMERTAQGVRRADQTRRRTGSRVRDPEGLTGVCFIMSGHLDAFVDAAHEAGESFARGQFVIIALGGAGQVSTRLR